MVGLIGQFNTICLYVQEQTCPMITWFINQII